MTEQTKKPAGPGWLRAMLLRTVTPPGSKDSPWWLRTEHELREAVVEQQSGLPAALALLLDRTLRFGSEPGVSAAIQLAWIVRSFCCTDYAALHLTAAVGIVHRDCSCKPCRDYAALLTLAAGSASGSTTPTQNAVTTTVMTPIIAFCAASRRQMRRQRAALDPMAVPHRRMHRHDWRGRRGGAAKRFCRKVWQSCSRPRVLRVRCSCA